MSKISQDIKDGTFERVYLLYGPEAFLKRSYKRMLRQAITGGDDMNFSSFEGKGPDLNQIRDLADTMPFLAERRLIILEDTGLFKTSSEGWAAWLSEIPDTATVLFVEEEVDKRNKLYKAVMTNGYAEACERQSGEQLMNWALRYLGKEGYRISRSGIEQLLSNAGDDMENLMSEMEKVMAYAGENKDITLDTVNAIGTRALQGQVFSMVEAIALGRSDQALALYYDLLALREPSMRILFLIARQFNQLMQVKLLTGQGMRQKELAERMKLRPFVAGKLMDQARAFSEKQLTSYVELCTSSEEAVKTGRLGDQMAVELVIMTIAGRRKVSLERRLDG